METLRVRHVVVFALAVCSLGLCQTGPPQDRAVNEADIHKAVYEITLATLTGKAEEFTARSAKRVLDLYELIYTGLHENPKLQREFAQAGVKSGRDFLRYSFAQIAARSGSVPNEKLQQIAQLNASAGISFKSDGEATVNIPTGQMRAIWEDQQWKIDCSDALKPSFLKLPLSAEARKRLEAF